ncbi:hypothetical protein HHI36_018777 [Cryptolaemus montrouzieri]|uniref:Uncharacterized protein n=1 Tax=Cryptolaemus montrouzieri TaxID=559131 RepID=A0ABD2P0Z6_9CUCU
MDRDHNNNIVKVSVENIVTEKFTDPGLRQNVPAGFRGRIEGKKEVPPIKTSAEKRHQERIDLTMNNTKKLRGCRKFLEKNVRLVLLFENMQEELKLDEKLDE